MVEILRTVTVTLAMLLFLANFSSGAVLFKDSFDEQPPWQPRPVINDASPAGGGAQCDFTTVPCAWPVPAGWSYFRSTGLWWGPNYQDTIRITGEQGRGGGGKSFIVYNESNNGGSGDGWGADGQLTRLFDQDMQELFARVYVKFQPGWQWPSNNDMMLKLFRAYHFDRTGSIYDFFSQGKSAPIVLWDLKHSNTYGTRGVNSFRGDPQETRYFMDGDSGADYLIVPGDTASNPSDPGMPADGNWHCLEFHVKMNSYDAATGRWKADGIFEVWNDGELKSVRNNVLWKSTGSDPVIGWNAIGLGGNAFNLYSDPANKAEQWYAMDDVMVSTSYSGPPAKPTNVSAQGISNSTITVRFRSGDNGATYPIDGFRVYYGTDAGSLTSFVTAPTSATEVTIPNLASATHYYIAVTAFNRVGSEVNENESLRATTSAVTVDTTPPAITVDPVVTPTIYTSQAITGTVSDAGGVRSVFVQVDGGEKRQAVVNGSAWSYLLDNLQPGAAIKVAVTAVDTAGNESGESAAAAASILILQAGDLSGDVSVGVEDAQLAMQMAVGMTKPDATQLLRGDLAPLVGGGPQPDGVIDTGDVLLILGIVTGITRF